MGVDVAQLWVMAQSDYFVIACGITVLGGLVVAPGRVFWEERGGYSWFLT